MGSVIQTRVLRLSRLSSLPVLSFWTALAEVTLGYSFMLYCPYPPYQYRTEWLEQAFLLGQIYIKIWGGVGEGDLYLLFLGRCSEDHSFKITYSVKGAPGKQLLALTLWADVTSSLPISLAWDVSGTQSCDVVW